jgi:hypothetical protein
MIEPRIERLATSRSPDRTPHDPPGVSAANIGRALEHLKATWRAAPYRTAKTKPRLIVAKFIFVKSL